MNATGTPLVLAADIGGTHARLGLAEVDAHRVRWLDRRKYVNAEHADFSGILDDFATGAPAPSAACLAVAGPTDGQHAHFTNLAWQLHADSLGHALGDIPARFVNDFAAAARALPLLLPDELHPLQRAPADADAPRLLLGAGTGLGVSTLLPEADGWRILPGEGGHADFAPVDARQAALWHFLYGEWDHVSYERVLSGAGLVNIYRFLTRLDPPAETPTAPRIVQAGLDGRDAAAVETLALFASLYGSFAGSLALILPPLGGLYIGGGLAPRMLPVLARHFMPAFRAKGRFSDWMARFPVSVVLADDLGMRGAALHAAALPREARHDG